MIKSRMKQDGHNIYVITKNNVPSSLSPKWLWGNSSTLPHDACDVH